MHNTSKKKKLVVSNYRVCELCY